MTLTKLRATRARDVDALEALLDSAEQAGRVLSSDEHERFRDLAASITAVDDLIVKEITMDTETPQGVLRSLTPSAARLSDGLPADIAQQVERSGRVAYEVKSSLRTISRNIVGENMASGVPPNINVAGPLAWRLVDGALPYSPSLLELLPVVGVSGAGILQHVLDYTPPDQAGNHAAIVPEATVKPESDLAVTTSTLVFQTWAHWVACTRQALSDIPSLRQLIDGILTRGLLRKVDAGIYATLAAAASTYTPAAGANTIDNASLAMAQIAALGGRNVTCVLNPHDLALANIAKCAGSGCYMGRPPDIAGGRIVASPAIPQGELFCFSSEAAYVAERESVSVIAGVKNDDFIKNLLTLLAEWRGIAVLSQPAYLLVGEIGAGATAPETQSAPLGRHAGAPRRA